MTTIIIYGRRRITDASEVVVVTLEQSPLEPDTLSQPDLSLWPMAMLGNAARAPAGGMSGISALAIGGVKGSALRTDGLCPGAAIGEESDLRRWRLKGDVHRTAIITVVGCP
jgi:hypothetical protein